MNILILTYEFPPIGGGGGVVAYQLAQRYVTEGHNVSVVTMKYDTLPAVDHDTGMVVYRVPCLRRRRMVSSVLEHITYLWSARCFLKQHLKHQTYDVVHAHFIVPTGLLAWWVYARYNVPYVVTVHGSDVPGFNTERFTMLHRMTGPWIRAIAAHARAVVAPSSYMAALLKHIRVGALVIPNGVDTNVLSPQPKERLILATGRLVPHKGFQHLLAAVASRDLGYTVHICGDGPLLSALQTLAAHAKTKVVVHGWMDSKSVTYRELLAKAAVYCLPSSRENASVALLEAMSSGCAIVAGDNPGSVEMLEEVGCTVPFGDVSALTRVLTDLTQNTQTLALYGKAARARACRIYDIRTVARNYLKLFTTTS